MNVGAIFLPLREHMCSGHAHALGSLFCCCWRVCPVTTNNTAASFRWRRQSTVWMEQITEIRAQVYILHRCYKLDDLVNKWELCNGDMVRAGKTHTGTTTDQDTSER